MGYSPNASNPLSSKSTAKQAGNSTGTTLAKCIPVKITSIGMETIDPSIETDVDSFAGVTRTSVNDGDVGEVVTSGLISDSGLSFAVGSVIYVSKSGGVTNSKPSIGVGGFTEGDFIIRLGVVIENESNPSLKDVLLNIQFLGQL